MTYDSWKAWDMPALPISNVREKLFGLVKQVNDNHDPVTVVTKTGENAILVAESDWNSIMETLYVLQTHGGVQLLKSAQDAREGRTEAHALIDPDVEEADIAPSETGSAAEAPPRELIDQSYAAGQEGAPKATAIAELRYQLDQLISQPDYRVALATSELIEDLGRRLDPADDDSERTADWHSSGKG